MSPTTRLLRKLALCVTACAVSLIPTAAHAQQVQFYHLDAIGNVRAVTDSSGNVIERHDYLPFGEECTTGPCATNPGVTGSQPKHFTGKERDTETGLDYFGARYYRNSLGRFTTVDPVYTWRDNLLDPQRWNRFSYGRNNPFRYVDPDGAILETTELERMREIAGPAGGKIQIVDGRVDVSGLGPEDLRENEGASLIYQLATSDKVYSYSEGPTVQTRGGPRRLTSGAENLDTTPDLTRYQNGKKPTDLPPAGIDDTVAVNPSVIYVDKQTKTRRVSTRATAFHELAEAYGKMDEGRPYGGPDIPGSAHEVSRQRERTLLGQRPDFTDFPAGESLARRQ